MKAVFVILIIALLCASASAQICIPVPFSLTHNPITTIIIPGLIDLYAGYQFVINGLTQDAQVVVTDLTVAFTVVCSNGIADQTFLYEIPDGTYTVPANSGSSWVPTQLFFSGFQSGPIKTRDVCGGNSQYSVSSATLSGGLISSETTLPVSIRFAYFSFIDLAHYVPSVPLIGDAQAQAAQVQQVNVNNAPVSLGANGYSSSTSVWSQICLSLSLLPPGIPTYSTTDTKTDTPSVTPTFSPTPSNSASFTRLSSTMRIYNSIPLRKFLKRG